MTLPGISTDPTIMLGKPVIAGTRITVELILDKLAAGEHPEQIMRAHPHLPLHGIDAALGYAAAMIRHEITAPLVRRSA